MTWIGARGLLAIFVLSLAACDGGDTEDAGLDSGPGEDAGPGVDAGFDAGPGVDAGPSGCQGAGCGFIQVNAAIAHTCAVRENGEIMCWGRNQEFQLGDGRERHADQCAPPGQPPEDCSGTPVNVRYLDMGSQPIIDDADLVTARAFTSTCSLRSGELWCWSNVVVNEIGGTEPEPLNVAERLFADVDGVETASVAGSNICYVQGANRQLFCAGSNGFGQLGRGTSTIREIMPEGVPFGTGFLEDIERVSVSLNQFACAATATAGVYCWGRGEEGQLGDGSATHGNCQDGSGMDLDCSRDAVEVGDPKSTPITETIDLETGRRHVCLIEGSGAMGQVYCWGDNRAGSIGQADTAFSYRFPVAVTGMDDVIDIGAGGDFTCALHADGTISCWGINSAGQLGDGMVSHGMQCTVGSVMEDCSPTPVTVATIDDAVSISTGSSHACAIRSDGSVWCWGNNNSRQLGQMDDLESNVPVLVQNTAPSM